MVYIDLQGVSMPQRFQFHDLEGVLIRQVIEGETTIEFSRWTGNCWTRYASIARVDYSGVRICERQAQEFLKDISSKERGLSLTDNEALQMLEESMAKRI